MEKKTNSNELWTKNQHIGVVISFPFVIMIKTAW